MTEILIGDQIVTYNAKGHGDQLVLEKGKTIDVVSGDGIFVSNVLSDVTIGIFGAIDVYGDKSTASGIFSYGLDTRINVAKGGKVEGDFGVYLRGTNDVLTNHGFVGGEIGVMAYSTTARIENFGRIGTAETAIGIGANNGVIVNAEGARITAEKGISFAASTGESWLENHGLIRSQGIAIDGVAGKEMIVNRGHIVGNIHTRDGNDRFDLRGGSVDGFVMGGKDQDLYIVNKTGGNLIERFDEGFDTVQSFVSWKLDPFFEQLLLAGNKDIKATGNELDNYIDGNKGDNRIKGLAGTDFLTGGLGDDTLTGGTEADLFIFIKGGGRDIVTDFDNGIDKLDISAWEGIDSFEDLMANHAKKQGKDLLLFSGDEAVLIRNMARADLDEADFFVL